MTNETLVHPVHTLHNRLLLPAGTELSGETLDGLISTSRATAHQPYSLLRHSSVKEDLLDFLSEAPYREVFVDEEVRADVLNLMNAVGIVGPVLESLDYFKKHDPYTYRHILVVSALSTLVAKNMFSDHQDRIQEAATAPSHDFGKVCVPLHILKKATPLTQRERDILKHHTAAGYVLLSYYLKDRQNPAARVARDHHERHDGSGYPRGIRVMDPMVEIVVATDIYDALISSRPYRPISYDNRTALEEITAMAERHEISWDVVKALVACNREDKPHFTECEVSAERRGTPPPGNLYGVTAEEDNHTSD
ncbi:MAG: HD domain-containing protein [Desulfobacterales bacterium]|nr:MAG: HD domain-containing protein [Desulfobacterales bacterium]